MSDGDLAALVARGWRYAMALTGDPHQAEDLVQDAWMAVLQARGPHRIGYLLSAVRSRWIDRHRRATPVLVELAPETRLGDDRGHAQADARMSLEAALDALRPEEREALYLCVVEGYSASEAGELLGRPRNTVLSLVHRARQKLRASLDEAPPLEAKEAMP